MHSKNVLFQNVLSSKAFLTMRALILLLSFVNSRYVPGQDNSICKQLFTDTALEFFFCELLRNEFSSGNLLERKFHTWDICKVSLLNELHHHVSIKEMLNQNLLNEISNFRLLSVLTPFLLFCFLKCN